MSVQTAGNKVVLKVSNISKAFYVADRHAPIFRRIFSMLFPHKYGQQVQALKNVSFEVLKGDCLGIIGKNGSGKSTLLKIIIGYTVADTGVVDTTGRLIRLALGMGFDAALTARDNIYLNGSILGLTFDDIKERFTDIIAFAELEKFIDTPLRFYSSGMRTRLALSIAMHAEADIFLIDEFFGDVGDERFKAKSNRIFQDKHRSRKTILFVSHFLNSIEQNCNKVLVIEEGIGHFFENVSEGIQFYKGLTVE